MNHFSGNTPSSPDQDEKPAIVLLYLGPDSMLPLASILAAIAGFFLIFWRYITRYVKKFFRWIRRQPDEPEQVASSEPVAIIGENEPKDQT
jgi:hypothetical protein